MLRRRSRGVLLLLPAILVACATAPGDGDPDGPAIVRFSQDAVSPESVRITTKGSVAWVSLEADSRAVVVFPASMASSFGCEGDLERSFRRTAAGFQSPPITSFESEPVALPCPLAPGVYDYEIWILEAGFGQSEAVSPARTLHGRIIVE